MYLELEDLWSLIKVVLVSALCAFGIYSCTNSDWYQASRRAEATQAAADAKPHVIREADGCKVYAFKSGYNWHYFTRCGETVTTERNYEEHHGKTTEHKTETIVTQGNK
jgi:hypothetical protein